MYKRRLLFLLDTCTNSDMCTKIQTDASFQAHVQTQSNVHIDTL